MMSGGTQALHAQVQKLMAHTVEHQQRAAKATAIANEQQGLVKHQHTRRRRWKGAFIISLFFNVLGAAYGFIHC